SANVTWRACASRGRIHGEATKGSARRSIPLRDDLFCCVVDHACFRASGCDRPQLTFELIHFVLVKCLSREIVAAPGTKICQMELCHVARRFFANHAFAVNRAPTGARKGILQRGTHIQFLAVVFLHLSHHLVIAGKGSVTRMQALRFMHRESSSRLGCVRPGIESGAWGWKMRQQEPAEDKICIANRERSCENV